MKFKKKKKKHYMRSCSGVEDSFILFTRKSYAPGAGGVDPMKKKCKWSTTPIRGRTLLLVQDQAPFSSGHSLTRGFDPTPSSWIMLQPPEHWAISIWTVFW